MPFGANDGQRINIRMSDMIRTRTSQGGGKDAWHSITQSNIDNVIAISVPYSDATRTSTGFRLSMMGAVLPYTDSDYNGADNGIYSIRNKLDGVFGSSGNMYEEPVIYSYMNSRYRSGSNASPTNIDPPFSSGAMSMGDMVGVGNSCLTTDNVGQTRGITNSVSGSHTKQIQGFHQMDENNAGGMLGIGMSPGGSVNSAGTKVGSNPDETTNNPNPSRTDTNAKHIGYSVYSTSHTNAWVHCKLNTKLTTGDRVLVVAHGGGGDMLTFTTTNPIYLRNESTGGSVAVSANISTHMAPHKNTTGSDDNLAIYSAECTGDGATVVGVNPFHSSAQPYLFHIFCIKGPNTFIDGIVNATVKYTGFDTTIKESYNGSESLYTIPSPTTMNRSQRFYINITSSPFNTNALALSASNIYDMTYSKFKNSAIAFGNGTAGYNSYYFDGAVGTSGVFTNQPLAVQALNSGSFFTSVCDYTGGTRGSSSTGKFGTNYNVLQGFYTPHYAYARPYGDNRVFMIHGRRGNPNHT